MLSKMALSLALMLTLATPVQAAGATTTGSIIRPGTSPESFLFSNPQRTYSAAGAQIFLDGAPTGSTRVFWVDTASTQVAINGASASMGELQVGDKVAISYRTTTALSISATR
jgi:hypothetical protein